MTQTDVIRIPGQWNIPYHYTIGSFASSFFKALRDKRILGCRCSNCERVSVPPKSFCEYCFLPVTELLEVGHDGVVDAVTVVTAPFEGSPPVPYIVAYVRLAGATSAIANYVRNVEVSDDFTLPDAAQVGAPVHVVFGDAGEGRVTDFWFEPGHAG